MKNHIKVNGVILQTNKKWSHLKRSQVDWIRQQQKLVSSLDELYERIQERGIWIPFSEIKKHCSVNTSKIKADKLESI